MENNTVLFVDDEPMVLSSIKRGLMDETFRCLFAENGKEALKMMEKEEISVLVTDMKMPEMNGMELLKKVKELYPDTVRIVLSGYTQLPQVLAAVNQGDIYKFITKPWKMDDEFLPVILSAIEQFNIIKKNRTLMEEIKKRNEAYQKIIDTTKNKYQLFQDEVRKVKQFSTYIFYMFKDWNEKKENQPDYQSLNEIIHLYEEIFIGYLDTVPSHFTHFELDYLLEEIQQHLLDQEGNQRIEFYKEDGDQCRCHGNYKLLFFFLKTMCKYLLTYEYYQVIPVHVSVMHKEEGTILLFSSKIKLKDVSDHLAVVLTMLKELAKLLNGTLTIQKDEENYDLKFEMQFTA